MIQKSTLETNSEDRFKNRVLLDIAFTQKQNINTTSNPGNGNILSEYLFDILTALVLLVP